VERAVQECKTDSSPGKLQEELKTIELVRWEEKILKTNREIELKISE
jgi:hypothetical protein